MKNRKQWLLDLCAVGLIFLGVAGLMVIFIPGTFSLLSSGDAAATSEPPNLYELTRQTAENTRHIFWVLVVGFVCLFGFYMPMLIRRNKAT